MRVVVSDGGTGGHITPGIAIATMLKIKFDFDLDFFVFELAVVFDLLFLEVLLADFTADFLAFLE